MQPVNWTRSRTRRQHLISLGIPVNLDEVLPRTLEKLPALQISTRAQSMPPAPRSGVPSSRPSSVNNSRAGSRVGSPQLPNANSRSSAAAQLRLGSKPNVDERTVDELLNLTPGKPIISFYPAHELKMSEFRIDEPVAAVNAGGASSQPEITNGKYVHASDIFTSGARCTTAGLGDVQQADC